MEVPGSKNFLIECRYTDFEELFDDSMVGYYENSIESLNETINRFLKDDFIRRKMANASYHEAINKHTFSHRFKDMFKIIGV